MKTTLISGNYNPETKVSKASIMTPLGRFDAHCKVHPDDEDIASSLVGCDIAERKAYIKALKAKKRIIVAEIKTLRDFHKRLEGCKEFNYHSFEARQLRKAIYEKEATKQSYENLITAYEKIVVTRNENRRKFLQKVKDKRG